METIVLCGWFGNHLVPGLAKFRLVLIVVITDFLDHRDDIIQ